MGTADTALMDEQCDVDGPVAFSPRRIGHMNLFVGELERSMAFYGRICGLEDVGRTARSSIAAGFLSNGNSHHDIGVVEATGAPLVAADGHVQIPKGRGKTPGLNHIGWEMENEARLVAAYHRARDAGLNIHRTTDHTLSRSVYVFDPDGNLHEIYADTMLNWRDLFEENGLDLLTTGWVPGEPAPSATPRYTPNPAIRRRPSSIFHTQRLTCCTLIARNFGRMRRFFADVMGFGILFESSQPNVVCFGGEAGGMDIVLVERAGGEPHGMHHFSLAVDDEGDLRSGERKLPGSEMVLEYPHKTSMVRRDPDGMIVELVARKNLSFSPLPNGADARYYY